MVAFFLKLYSFEREKMSELKELFKLTGPIFVAQITHILMSVVDTLMSGRAGEIDLAAVAVGSSIWTPITLFIFGFAIAIAPVISQTFGAQKYQSIPHYFHQGFYACTLGAFFVYILMTIVPYLLVILNLEKDFLELTLKYLSFIKWSIPGMVLYMALRNYCEGLSHTMPSLVIGFIGLAINIPANYIFIYGKLGLPAFGGAGAGIASAIVYTGMGLGLLIYVLKAPRYSQFRIFQKFEGPKIQEISHFIKLGLPISLTLFFEVSLFAVVAILIAPLGTTLVAGHQVALNISSIVYMFPLSLSMALTLRVGFLVGAQHFHLIMPAYKLALGIGLSFAIINGLGMWLGGSWLSSFYTEDQNIIHISSSLLGLAALFTISDTFQALSMGALRGHKDTRFAMVITFIGYWIIGLPIGHLLATTDKLTTAMGPAGYWIGFIVSLSFAGVLLTIHLIKINRMVTHDNV